VAARPKGALVALAAVAALVVTAAARGARGEPRPRRAALVAAGAPGPSPERLVAVAAELPSRGLTLAPLDEETRRILVSLEDEPSAEEEVRAQLTRARERLRRFDLDAAAAALEAAWRAVERLAPTGESRALAVEVALREVDLALVRGAEPVARAAAALALSVSPRLTLDARKERPELVRFVEARRAAASAEHTVTIRTAPPGASIFVGERLLGATPAAVRLRAEPQLVWLTAPGSAPRAIRVAPSPSSPSPVVDVTLPPEPLAARTRPLVDAVRRSTGDVQRAAAAALGAALEVDAIVVVSAAAAAPLVISVEPTASSPPSRSPSSSSPSLASLPSLSSKPPAPARRRVALGVALGIVGALAVGAAVGLGVGLAPRTTYDVACCR